MPYALSCLASVIVPAARGYKQNSRITMDVMFDFDALDEVPSLADSQPFMLEQEEQPIGQQPHPHNWVDGEECRNGKKS